MARRFNSKSGMSLVEVSIASLLFALIGYILTTSVEIGVRSHATVSESISSMSVLRETAGKIRQTLKMTQDASVIVTALPSGDSELTLMQPITVGGAQTWGVNDPRISAIPAEQSQAGWSKRFTVVSTPDASIPLTGQRNDLVLRILDDGGATRFEETLISNLFQGGNLDPGFSVQATGSLWSVSLQSAGHFTNTKGPSTILQVRARN